MARRFPRPRSLETRRHRDVGVAAASRTLFRDRYRRAQASLRQHWLSALIAAALLVFGGILMWPAVRFHLQSLAVLKLVSGEPLPAPAAWVTNAVEEHDLTIPTSAGAVRARMYSPVGRTHPAGMLVFHGVHHLGMNEPRLIRFANAMAASGLQVITPELPDIKDYHIGGQSITVIGESAQWYAAQQHRAVSVMGLSFSGGLSLVAAANPAYRPSMKLIFAVGSQDAMDRVAAYYRTGSALRPDGSVEVLPAHEYGPLVLEYEHLEEFVPAADVGAIRNVLKAHLYEDKAMESDAMELLSPRQKTEAAELMDAGSQTVREMLRVSELRHRKEMDGLSPEAHIRELEVPVFLLHGEADNIIPAAETLWMASELRSTTLQAALVSPVLSHIDMQKAPDGRDEWKLVHFMALVLRSAEQTSQGA